jgi:hypothetical protein
MWFVPQVSFVEGLGPSVAIWEVLRPLRDLSWSEVLRSLRVLRTEENAGLLSLMRLSCYKSLSLTCVSPGFLL